MINSLAHRKITGDDLEIIYRMYMDEQANRYLTFDPMTLEEFWPVFEELKESGDCYIASIYGRVIGTYRLTRLAHRRSHIMRVCNFAVRAGETNKGYATQMLAGIKKMALQAGVRRLEVTIDPDNFTAIRICKKAGFKIEATIPMSYTRSDSTQYFDEFMMTLLLPVIKQIS